MKVEWKNYPIDVIICLAWSIATFMAVILDLHAIRVLFGLPFILFIPGYVLVFALFPGRDISLIERIALSFGLSIAIVPLIGLALNYTPWGIRLEPILISLTSFVFVISAIGWYRWQHLPVRHHPPLKRRFFVSIDIHFPKGDSKLENVLTVVLIISILISVSLLAYIVVTPHVGESFTEFYLLGPSGKAEGYPTNLSLGENGTVIIGIANHEHEVINYTVEIWLVNQSWRYNESSKENESAVHDMWFMKKIEVQLNFTTPNMEEEWKSQWEYNYSFNITKRGSFKVAFLLFKGETNEFIEGNDYPEEEKRLSQAYRECHLWITMNNPPVANFTYNPCSPTTTDSITFIDTSFDSDGYIVNRSWDFGDGNRSYGENTLIFDGVNDYIDCGNDTSPNITTNCTIEFWFKPRDFTRNYSCLIQKNGAYAIQFLPSKKALRLYDYGHESSVDSDAIFTEGEWQHAAMVKNGSRVTWYRNGVIAGKGTLAGDAFSTSMAALYIGIDKDLSSNAFSGDIKGVRIYNRTLMDIEIENNYQGNITTGGLVSWWMLNEGHGSIAYDSTPNYNRGTIFGATWKNCARHSYAAGGNYMVTLVVRDDDGGKDSISKPVAVT
ncbi:MAG: DUF1616 domain-containing protein [Candidatus Thermoplasmatota archaeon]|nr:DUF1616 domain-containing protein [Candidatus Thermoplasmatota archaeon]